jgi:hypothetical protein
MRNPFRNPQSNSWIELTSAKLRGRWEGLWAAADGLNLWHKWMIGALICALSVGSISLVASGSSSKKEGISGLTSSAASEGETARAKAETTRAAANAPTPKEKNGEKAAEPEKNGEAAKEPAPAGQEQVLQKPSATKTKAEPEEEEDNVRARAQWFHDQRAYPFKYIPSGALQKAIQQRDAMKLRQRSGAGLQPMSVINFPGDGLWHLMGPQPTNRPFGNISMLGNSGFPTTSGRVTAIAVDPTDVSGQTVYIGGAAGGVWKTIDGGTHWASLTDSQPSLAVGSIAIDPNNHLTIYVGTGEDDFNLDGYYGAGILKSTDGGSTWTQLGASIFAGSQSPFAGGAQIGAIAVQPGNPLVVLAAVDFFDGNDPKGGVYQSLDGGTTWHQPAAGAQGSAGTGVVFESTSVASATGATAWAALGDIFPGAGSSNGIWKSTDSGAHWTLQAGGLPTTNVGRITLGYAPSTASLTATVYAAIGDASTPASRDLLGLFKTVNGGTTWSPVTGPAVSGGFCAHQCYYDMAIGVHPTNPSVVVVGGGAGPDNFTSLFETTNGGATWTGTGTDDFSGPNGGVHPHVDTHAIVFTPQGTTLRLYLGNDGGMWRTDNPSPGGVSPTWVDLNTQLAITQFYPGPSAGIGDENYGFGGTQDNDTELFSGTLDWTGVQACGDGGFTAIDSQTPTTVYTTCAPGSGPGLVAKSVFNGAVLAGPTPSFVAADNGIAGSGDQSEFIPPLTIDDNNPTTLYYGTCRIWQTFDGAANWTAITGDLASGTNTLGAPCSGAGNITTMDVPQKTSSIVFAGTSNGKVWSTTNAFTWAEIDNGLLPARHVTAVRGKRGDTTGTIAYVTFSGFGSCAGCDGKGHIFKTINGGTAWTDISGDLPDAPVNDIIVYHQGTPTFDALYIATDVGVFSCENPEATTNTCSNWTVIGDGLPNSPILGLAMRRQSRILRAATHGRSMWQIQLTDVQPPAVASLGSLTPAAVMVGAPTTVITVTGVNFSPSTKVLIFGSSTGITTTFVNTTQLSVSLSSSFFLDGIVYPVTLSDPAGADSSSLPFTVMNPIVSPATMSPTSAFTSVPLPLHFTGTGYVPSTIVTFSDTSDNPLFTVSGGTPSAGGTVFDITVPAVDLTTPATYHVSLSNPLPGGGGVNGFFLFTLNPNPNPLAIFNPTIIVMGPTALGATSTPVTNVTITNPGGANLTIAANGEAIAGTNGTLASNFAFATPSSGVSCGFPSAATVTVNANGGTCTFAMTFSPDVPPGLVTRTGTLTLTDNGVGNPQVVQIIGLVPQPNTPLAILTPNPVNFGPVPIGTTSPTMIVTLTSVGALPVNVTSTGFTISGGTNPADFHLISASGTNPACPLPPTTFTLTTPQACDVGVAFSPSTPPSVETSTLNVADNVTTFPQTTALTGSGIEITSISPSVVATGGPAFTLTVNGGGFAPSAVVNVNGSARLTTFVSATQVLASIPASDIVTAGSLAISVTTPVPGGTPSEPKTLIVAQAPPATNDNINFAINTSTTPYRSTQDTTQATVNTDGFADPAPTCTPGGATQGGKARSVWFKFIAPATGRVIADTRFSSYTTILSAWTGTAGSLVAVTGACATGNVSGTTTASLLGFGVTSGTTYLVMVTDASAGGAGGTLTFSLDFSSTIPANDDNATPTNITATPFSNTVNTIEATPNTNGHIDPALPGGCATGAVSSGQANSVWYSFTPASSGTVTADTLTSPYDTILNVTSGTPNGTQVECNNDAGTGIAQSRVSFAATSGTPYFFMVSAFLGDGGTTNFHLAFSAGGGGVPATIAATSGTPQSATINTAFAAPLVATVKDSLNNPVSGALVTFTPPASGASGTFAGGVNTATTNGSGVATSATFTANATAGGPYNVAATVGGVATPANFALTNTAGAAANVAATSGSGQSATISTAFAAPLVATVTDAGNNPVSGVVVTFTPPVSGASGTFAGGVNTATTNGSGVATSAVFTANATAGGPYNVVASATGATSANFSLTNKTGGAAKVAATSGSGQSATISTAFAAPLVAAVTDAGNNPVSGVVVTFTPPASGASGTFAGGVNTATTNASGVATSAVFTANATAGGPYNVVASATGATSANFSLTNNAGTAAKVTATSGTPQSVAINMSFAAPLVATVTDAGNNPVSGVVVTFTPPTLGASGTFAGGLTTATTNASGVATSATFTANATVGGPYNVVASAAGATSANFSLTNKTGAAAKVAATSGSGQVTTINTAFAAPLMATVTDAGSNPVSGVLVTFTPPASGASGTFAGGVNTATTNASGVATSALFTANGMAGGPYNVVASATGATSANFALTNTSTPSGKVATTSGSGQSAVINAAFGAPLIATVTDAGNNPVSGVVVTFTPPASGASGTFGGGVNTATTNASGVAISAAFTANSTAGSYNVVASSPNDTSANFALTNTVGPAAKVTATSGSGQSTAINAAFAAVLVATVTDAGNNPVSGVVVTFTPPASGASGTFAGGVNTETTNASGVATSAVFTANATAGGPYNVVASATGATSANFSLTNNAGAAAKVTATSGSGQSAAIGSPFAAPLVATVTDVGNNPVSGVVVTFTAPASGAGGTFAGGVNTATTNASGVATSATFTANATVGGPYNVVASATGATSANFSLTNKTGAAAKVTATSGTPQSVAISTAFAAPLVATVADSGNNPVSGVVVTFAPPASGASGTFAGGVNIATTNASGVATSATFTANATAGGPYNVVASATGATSANFSLTNLTGTPASVTATAGTPQGTPISTAFPTQLQATVKDAGSNPVSGVVVTFTAPASGASGTFAGGVNTATTDAGGVATAPVFTANGTVGAYTVNATVAGVVTPTPFMLTNNAGPAASITATAGTPQNAVINTAFTILLQATVKDAGSNAVSGVTVTFAAPASGGSGTFAGGATTAITNASGVATAAVFTANATAGAYTVTAKVSGVATAANFSLTNTPGPPASVTATAGTPQTTTINAAFATQLQATVKDAGNNLVSGAIVTFTAPASGASGTFAGGVSTATTNAGGVATASVFTANATAGAYTVTAKIAGVAAPANFSLTNDNVQPTLTSVLPASTLAGGAAFSLTINGNNFVNGATVSFGTDAALVPTSTTPTQILVSIPAADIAKAGQLSVTVTNPAPSAGPSLAQTFTVNNPVPTLTSLGQLHAAGGTAFTLTVNGTNFVATSVVNFGAKAEPTTLVSPTQVTAAIPATDVSSAGMVNVTVVNPTPGGGPTPTSVAFTVDGFTLTGPGSAITVKAGMTATIPITITPTTNGFSNPVTFSVTGLPAHASLVPLMVTPGATQSTVNVMITTTAHSAAPPAAPMDQPLTPILRMLLVCWIAALLAGFYAARMIRKTPRLRRYAAIVPLVLLLVSGAVLAGCASGMNGTPVGTSQLTITATSGTLSHSTPATLTVQ